LPTGDNEPLLAYVDQIYDAALDPSKWPTALATLGRALKSEVSALFVQDMGSNAVGFLESIGQEASVLSAYREHYSKVNLWLEKSRHLPAGVLVHTPELVDNATLEQSEFYNDWLRPQGVYYSLGCTVLRKPAIETHVTLLRSPGYGPYSEAERALFSQLSSHIRRAVEIHRRIHIPALAQEGILRRLERMSLGVAIVDRECRLLFINTVAEEILRQDYGLTALAGRLGARTAEDTRALVAHVEQAINPPLTNSPDSGLLVLRHHPSRPLSILISALPADDRLGINLSERVALLFIHVRRTASSIRQDDLIVLYGLTPGEAKLMKALLDGQRLSEYAKNTNLSINTVKSYLKEIFLKTGSSRQADLFRRVLSNPLLQFL